MVPEFLSLPHGFFLHLLIDGCRFLVPGLFSCILICGFWNRFLFIGSPGFLSCIFSWGLWISFPHLYLLFWILSSLLVLGSFLASLLAVPGFPFRIFMWSLASFFSLHFCCLWILSFPIVHPYWWSLDSFTTFFLLSSIFFLVPGSIPASFLHGIPRSLDLLLALHRYWWSLESFPASLFVVSGFISSIFFVVPGAFTASLLVVLGLLSCFLIDGPWIPVIHDRMKRLPTNGSAYFPWGIIRFQDECLFHVFYLN